MKFDIKLTPESQRILDGLVKAGKIDLRPSLIPIGIGYRKEVAMIFGHQQSRGQGMQWAPLSEKYAAWKEKHYPGRPLLVRTGALRASMTVEGARGNINVIGKNGAVFGSSISYGVFHDQGTVRLPQRNFSEPSERRLKIWETQLTNDLIHNFKDNGIDVKGDVLQ